MIEIGFVSNCLIINFLGCVLCWLEKMTNHIELS